MIVNPAKYMALPFSQCNCWQLVNRVYSDLGIAVPEFTLNASDRENINLAYQKEKNNWLQIDAPQAPCVAAMFNDSCDPLLVNHFGVFIGDDTILHTVQKQGVGIFKLNHPLWRYKIEGFYVPCNS